MPIQDVRFVSNIRNPDDAPLFVIRKDFSGGVNTRQHASMIGENQAETLYNVDLGVAGQSSKRAGSVLIGNDVGNVSPAALCNYTIQGGTDQLLMFENTTLWKWEGSGNWASLKADFSASTDVGILPCKESGLSPDDVVIVQNGTDNAFRIDSEGNIEDLGSTAGTGSDSPPKSTVMTWYNNRVWILKNDLLYFSDAYPASYSNVFDTVSNYYRIPVGSERKLMSTRDMGIVVMGEKGVWSLMPSSTPVATDQPQPLITNLGCVSKRGAVQYGDDIFFFAQDGLRGLKRTVQDKLQLGATYPISYALKTQFESISWAYISNLTMETFDNKIFIGVPTGATTYDTWVYYPSGNCFMIITGWSPTCWATYKVGGEERLYYGQVSQGKVYRGWYGYTDEGSTTTTGTKINYQEEGRKENLGQPLIKKLGGELEIEANTAGNYDIDTYISLDSAGYNFLGKLNLSGDNPVVGVAVVGDSLGNPSKVSKKFHFDNFGAWKEAQVKLQHDATNGEDTISIYSRVITAFPESYENE